MSTKNPPVDLQDDACISELTDCVESLLKRYPSITVFAALIAALETGGRELQRTGHLTHTQLAEKLEQLKRRTLAEPEEHPRYASRHLI